MAPSDGADITILGDGSAGMVEVLDVPVDMRAVAPEGLAALSFMTDDFTGTLEKARAIATDVVPFEALVPGVELFKCTMGGVLVEFMGSYAADVAGAPAQN